MGGKTEVVQPTPPAAPSTADAMNAYIAGMPAMYQAQLDWQPKLAAQDIAMMQQFLPQITQLEQGLASQYAPQQAAQQWELQKQYAPLYAEQQQQMQQQYEPGAYAALQNLGTQMTPNYLSGQGAFNVATDPTLQAMQGMVNPEWMTGYSAQEAPGMEAARERLRQSARGAWASRGLAESGMSAEDETRMLSEFELPYAMQQEALTQQVAAQRQGLGAQVGSMGLQAQQNAWQNYYSELGRRQNIGLSLAGRYNVPVQSSISTPQINLPNYQAPNVMAGYSFPQVQNSMMQGYGNYANAYSNMYNANAQFLPTSNAQRYSQTAGYWSDASSGGGLNLLSQRSSIRYKKNVQLWKTHSNYYLN